MDYSLSLESMPASPKNRSLERPNPKLVQTNSRPRLVPPLGLTSVGTGAWMSGQQTSGETYVSYYDNRAESMPPRPFTEAHVAHEDIVKDPMATGPKWNKCYIIPKSSSDLSLSPSTFILSCLVVRDIFSNSKRQQWTPPHLLIDWLTLFCNTTRVADWLIQSDWLTDWLTSSYCWWRRVLFLPFVPKEGGPAGTCWHLPQ